VYVYEYTGLCISVEWYLLLTGNWCWPMYGIMFWWKDTKMSV